VRDFPKRLEITNFANLPESRLYQIISHLVKGFFNVLSFVSPLNFTYWLSYGDGQEECAAFPQLAFSPNATAMPFCD
jgi:hypothetical protein